MHSLITLRAICLMFSVCVYQQHTVAPANSRPLVTHVDNKRQHKTRHAHHSVDIIS